MLLTHALALSAEFNLVCAQEKVPMILYECALRGVRTHKKTELLLYQVRGLPDTPLGRPARTSGRPAIPPFEGGSVLFGLVWSIG